ncbi:maleylpyruvate isomerase family mycothiol-dependent enzyme [Nocardioides mangrovi]|uniref:Maleylpyruvate isomerase family mycothiol-dependent enzyme n=1 Tax=Nocardioides mangrovi TaxID=2874580 RepID=A0ABS7UF67_9ACTN|nr:maleylpyruvate isomerase family mycothiol-dependent enzyme [Nocardioides mangrovi]MBZ5739661.1 maleylpyruvate isomerase family mycothiol-dependent enzyme [Nocardioides mangrovi]
MTHDWTALLATATDRFARLTAEADPTAPVASCPGWTVADLVDHVGGVHQWARHAIVAGTPDGQAESPSLGADAAALASWYAGHAGALRDALAGDPTASAWTFGTEQTAGWWLRRQVHETTMHTRDLLDAAGRVDEWILDPGLAWDGVREVATEFYPRQVRLGRTEPLPGTLRLVATDLAIDPVVLGDATPEVELAAPAAEVLLMVWKRRTAEDPAAAALLALPVTP